MVEITGDEDNMILLEKMINHDQLSKLSDKEIFNELRSAVNEFKEFTEKDINDFIRTIEQNRVNGLYISALINVYFKRNPDVYAIDIEYKPVSTLLKYLAINLPASKKVNFIF